MGVKLLWVEDQANKGALSMCTLEIEKTGSYELTTIRDASTAEKEIKSNKFDVIIFDLRILAGVDPYWEEQRLRYNSKLGIKLIERVYDKIISDGTSYGILSVEEWYLIEKPILSIDDKFNSAKQYLRKDDIVYNKRIIKFLQNL